MADKATYSVAASYPCGRQQTPPKTEGTAKTDGSGEATFYALVPGEYLVVVGDGEATGAEIVASGTAVVKDGDEAALALDL